MDTHNCEHTYPHYLKKDCACFDCDEHRTADLRPTFRTCSLSVATFLQLVSPSMKETPTVQHRR